MSAVRLGTFRLTVMLATAFPVAILSTAGHAYTPEQQQACSNDAFRLCNAEIPDVDRVTVCMIRNKSQLSPECRVYFGPAEPEPAVTRATARKPLSIKPATAKPPKSKKPKKSADQD
jgi:hypothetical protein